MDCRHVFGLIGAALVTALAGTLASPVVAAGKSAVALPPAQFKPAAPGTTITWKNRETGKVGTVKVIGVEGFLVKYTWNNGREHTARVLCQHCEGRAADIDEKAYAALWPLEVGKTVTVERRHNGKQWTNEISVVGTERLELPFGSVDTYHVVDKSRKLSCCWSGTKESWYAPALGWTVRLKTTDTEKGSSFWEAVDVKVPN